MRDRTGALRAIWFNQPFLNDVFRPHQRVILFGKLELTSHGLQLQNPQYRSTAAGARRGRMTPRRAVHEDDTLHTGRIVPIYEKTGTVTTKMQRVLVHHALAQLPDVLPDPLPAALRARHGLLDRRTAIGEAHFPPEHANLDELNGFRSPAQRRLIFEEFFLFQCGLVLRKRRASAEVKPRAVVITDEIRESARRVLPFKLTGDQKKVIAEIVGDMKRPQPMNRLLQGDVGSGKTIVALMAALVAMENGFQVAFMAPTEILAEQHYINIRRLLRVVAIPHGAPDRHDGGEEAARDAGRARGRIRCSSSSARTRSSRTRSRFASWDSRSSTSSTASASCSARRFAPRACTPTSWS